MTTASAPRATPKLGLGGGALGDLDAPEAFALLDAARDAGCALVDVARSYGDAEARVGAWRRLRGREGLAVITKGGYGVEGVSDWSPEAVERGAEAASRRLGGAAIEGFLLHSCAASVLRRAGLDEACGRVLARGLARRVGYAGDNVDLHVAIDEADRYGFTVFELSASLLDGRQRVHALPRLRARGHTVLAKRALANAPWSIADDVTAPDLATQRRRFARAAIPDVGVALDELFLRFAAYGTGRGDGADVVLVGTRRPAAIVRAAAQLARGPLPDAVLEALAPSLARCDDESVT